MGCISKFWFTGLSLGRQLALWVLKAAADFTKYQDYFGLKYSDISDSTVIAPI
jgi:predicted alpha/beta-fold hydrolase